MFDSNIILNEDELSAKAAYPRSELTALALGEASALGGVRSVSLDECSFDECSLDECSLDECSLDECSLDECSLDVAEVFAAKWRWGSALAGTAGAWGPLAAQRSEHARPCSDVERMGQPGKPSIECVGSRSPLKVF